jgi:hypothetical protein
MRNEEVSAVSEKKYGPVAQRIEQRFPKPLVGGSTPPGAPTLQTRTSSRFYITISVSSFARSTVRLLSNNEICCSSRAMPSRASSLMLLM